MASLPCHSSTFVGRTRIFFFLLCLCHWLKKSISLFSSSLWACFCLGTYQDDSPGLQIALPEGLPGWLTLVITFSMTDSRAYYPVVSLFQVGNGKKKKRKLSPPRYSLFHSPYLSPLERERGLCGESPGVLTLFRKISFLWHLMICPSHWKIFSLFQESHNNLCALFCLISANLLPVRVPTGCLISALLIGLHAFHPVQYVWGFWDYWYVFQWDMVELWKTDRVYWWKILILPDKYKVEGNTTVKNVGSGPYLGFFCL